MLQKRPSKRFMVTGLALLIAVLAWAAYEAFCWPVPPTKEEWLQHQAERLRRLQVTADMVAAARPWTALDDLEYQYDLNGEGVIPLGNGDWVYAVTHTFHQPDVYRRQHPWLYPVRRRLRRFGALFRDTAPDGGVADAILIMDSRRRFFTNDGHVCYILQLVSEKPVMTVDDLLQTRTDAKNRPWLALP